MAARRTADKSINTQLQKGQKSTQLERLLAGMVAAANQGGYAEATVSQVIANAGVSRPTFYDYFADRDECFVACAKDAQSRLLEDVRSAVGARAPEDALAGAVEALVAFAVTEPAKARFLMTEALAGGAAALDARDAGVKKTAQVVERALARVPAEQPIPDLSIAIAIGAVCRLLGMRLRRGERALGKAHEDLLTWTASYARPARARRWHALAAAGSIVPSLLLASAPLRAPARLGPGRPRLPEEEVAENHRQRILFATAAAIAERGYEAATIADITKLAGVDGRAFYRLFADKREVFDASYGRGLRHMLAIVARAYFAGDSWPERMWEALRVVTESAQSCPAGARVGLIAPHAVGPAAIQRVEDSSAAFTIFLHEGYRHGQQANQPSVLALEAIAASVFEVLYRAARERNSRDTAGLLPQVTHLCLAPFMGPQDADRFIDRQLGDGGERVRRVASKSRAAAGTRRRRGTPATT